MTVRGLLHRHLWPKLPRAFRRAVLFRAMALRAPCPSLPAPPLAPPFHVVGFHAAPTGLGEGARRMLRLLRQAGLPAHAVDVSAPLRQAAAPPPIAVPEGPGTLIVHVNGPMLPWALAVLGARAVRGKRVIAFWAWELPVVPAEWDRGARFAHAIWTPSRFCADAFARPGWPPVQVVPHPVWPMSPHPDRARFGLPPDAFVTLCLFDAGSSLDRKNPLGAIEAHRRAFGDAPDHLLVLKTHGLARVGTAAVELRTACSARNIRLLDEQLDACGIAALIASADVLLSLHRAEGFGLVLAEAMALGVRVVATGWSGNVDFCPPETRVPFRLVPAVDRQHTYALHGATWAEPDIGAAAAMLRASGPRPAPLIPATLAPPAVLRAAGLG